MTLSNLSPLANEYAALKDQADAINARLDALKEEIKASGVDLIEGDNAVLKISLAERVTVNTAAVRKILTDAQFAEVSKASVYSVIRVDRKRTV